MVLTASTMLALGASAPPFALPDTSGTMSAVAYYFAARLRR